MKLEGFIGGAYQLDSVNVDNQRCVNMYVEQIESGKGKAGQQAYLRATPGLEEFMEVGDGPIRCLHVDSIGRIFVVSGSQLFLVTNRVDWTLKIAPVAFSENVVAQTAVNTGLDYVASAAHGFYTGQKVRVASSNTLPTGLTAATDYWIYTNSVDHFYLCSSLANALAATPVNITAQGTGNLTTTPQIPTGTTSVSVIDDVDVSTDEISAPAHGLHTGLKVRLGIVGEMPTGLATSTDYYVIATSADSFELASSVSDASAGTAVDITAISTEEWSQSLIGEDGHAGGDPMPLSTNTGVVKAASMSFGGEGTDSSTIFVDGVNNYLFQDDAGETSFGILGEVQAARATMDCDTDIVLTTTQDAANLIANGAFQLRTTQSTAGSNIYIDLYTESHVPNTIRCAVFLQNSATFTTADFVQYVTHGFVTGKTILFNTLYSLVNYQTFSQFTATGGDTQSMLAAFPLSATAEPFAEVLLSGADYGSVPTATDIKWSDGYFILAEGGTNRFRVSDLQSFNVDALSFASSEGSPDLVLAIGILNRYLYVFNEKTTEVYANVGNPDFPFERVQGGFIEVGCAAAHSVQKVGGSLCFLGRSEDGDGVVYAIEGLQPRRISTHAVEQAIRGYSDPSSAVAYTYQSAGHAFYALNFAEGTWVYDFATGLWHERAYTNEGELERHRVEHCVFVQDQRIHLVADYETNELFTMSEDVYSDNENAITRLRTCPHISSGGNNVFCSKLTLDMEVGIGLDGGVQGSSPEVMLDWSNDGGHTWSSESWALADAGAGQIGDYLKRVIWRRLGRFRQRVFRFKMTDPVKIRWIDAQIELEGGQS